MSHIQQDMCNPEENKPFDLPNTGDINVIYTLDNYVTIEGNFKYGNSDEIYYSKSGYLLPFISTIDENDHTQKNTKLSVRVLLGDSTDENQIYNYNQNEIQQYIENGNPIKIQILNDLDRSTQW